MVNKKISIRHIVAYHHGKIGAVSTLFFHHPSNSERQKQFHKDTIFPSFYVSEWNTEFQKNMNYYIEFVKKTNVARIVISS